MIIYIWNTFPIVMTEQTIFRLLFHDIRIIK